MGKKLVITEKPSVGMAFARVLGAGRKQNGFMEGDEYVVTWCIGHLIALSYPEKYDEDLKKWKKETLPFLPKEYKYEVIKDVSAQWRVVKSQICRTDLDAIYYAGDPAREGIYIQSLVRMMAGRNSPVKELCVWIDSQTDDEIMRGIREAKPMSEYDDMADSGYERAIEDYATGINLTRAYSLKYGDMLCQMAGKERSPISAGRVMTCVLGMIAGRERQIRNFKETPFWKVAISTGGASQEWKLTESSAYAGSSDIYKDNGFLKKEDADALGKKIAGIGAAIISEKTIKREKKRAPMPYNLAELQNDCSRLFKMTPSETLATAQELYEMKLLSYPRTDSRALSTAIAKEAGRIVGSLCSTLSLSNAANMAMSAGTTVGKPYADDSKVTDHYAIIPTGNGAKGLTKRQQDVWELVSKRFLSVFLPPAEYEKTSVKSSCAGETFTAAASVLKVPGWMAIYGSVPENDTPLSALEKGREYHVDSVDVKEGKTTPPTRYTSGSIILAMENAGQLIEDPELRAQIKGSGIGTSATRAETLSKLERIGYIKLNRKTQALSPEPYGEMVYDLTALTVPEMLDPKMTAQWERDLDEVANGRKDRAWFRNRMEQFVSEKTMSICNGDVTKELMELIQKIPGSGKLEKKQDIGTCPECGKPLAVRKGKNGPFTACTGYPDCRYVKQEEFCKCPRCKKTVTERSNGWFCTDRSCGVALWKDNSYFKAIGGKLNGKKAKELMEKGRTEMKGLVSKKTGKTYDAWVLADFSSGRPEYSMEFEK